MSFFGYSDAHCPAAGAALGWRGREGATREQIWCNAVRQESNCHAETTMQALQFLAPLEKYFLPTYLALPVGPSLRRQ